MKQVIVDLGDRNYHIDIAGGLLDRAGEYVLDKKMTGQLFIITDENVQRLYSERLSTVLEKTGIGFQFIAVPPGEKSKSMSVLDRLYTSLIKAGATRRATIAAFGGGVVGDLAGFLAASYMRGVRYAQIPTTLLSQVDSSVGGKVGINHRMGKNLIGAFYQPQFVLIDPFVLKSLPERELRAGMAEVIKYGFIRDQSFFAFLDNNIESLLKLQDNGQIEEMIRVCCKIKADVVIEDERESGVRAILNFGHTIGHALEAVTGYSQLLHGEAVMHGIRGALYLSRLEGRIDDRILERGLAVVEKLQPPVLDPKVTVRSVRSAMEKDKKRSDKGQLWVLLNDFGEVELTRDVNPGHVDKAIEFVIGGGN